MLCKVTKTEAVDPSGSVLNSALEGGTAAATIYSKEVDMVQRDDTLGGSRTTAPSPSTSDLDNPIATSPFGDDSGLGAPPEPHRATGERGAGQAAREQVRSLASEVRDQARSKANEAKDQVGNLVGQQKTRAAERLSGVAGALRQAAGNLNEGEAAGIGRFAADAAGRIDRLAGYLRDRELGDLVGDAENLARRRPEIFLGATFLGGLLLARFLKSTSERPSQVDTAYAGDYGTADYGGSYGAGSYGTGATGTGSYGTGAAGTGSYGTGSSGYGTGSAGAGSYGTGSYGSGSAEVGGTGQGSYGSGTAGTWGRESGGTAGTSDVDPLRSSAAGAWGTEPSGTGPGSAAGPSGAGVGSPVATLDEATVGAGSITSTGPDTATPGTTTRPGKQRGGV